MYEPAAGLLTPPDIYRAACALKSLPENFATSMRAYVFYLERGHNVYDVTTDNYYSPSWGTALRAAIGQAEEWLGLDTIAEYHGNTLLRRIAQELCRDTVPPEERLL